MANTSRVIKYDRAGNLKWAYVGIGHVRGMVLDYAGNLLIGGITGIAKIRSVDAGVIWRKPDRAEALAIGPDNSVVVAVLSDDAITRKFSPDGTLLWERRFHLDEEEGISDIEVAADGTIYFAGTTGYEHDQGSEYMLTLKYSSDGVLQGTWTADIGRPCGASNIMLDASGHPIVQVASQYQGSVLFKLNEEGGFYWSTPRLDFERSKTEMDSYGNIFIGGQRRPFGTNIFHLALSKIGHLGEVAWNWMAPGSSMESQYGYGLALDHAGNVYLSGRSEGSSYSTFRPLILKFNTNGHPIWQYRRESSDTGDAVSLTLDAIGNVLVSGTSFPPNVWDSTLVLKMDQRQSVLPFSAEVVTGQLVGGGLDSLFGPDGRTLAIAPDESDLDATLRVSGKLLFPGLHSLTFLHQSTVSRPGIVEEILFLYPSTQAWTLMRATIADQHGEVGRIEVTQNAGRFLGIERVVSAEIRWRPLNDESPAQDGWVHFVDLATWEVVQ